MGCFCSCLREKDRLRISETENKTECLTEAIEHLNQCKLVFRPSLASCHWIFKGNVQTLVNELFEKYGSQIKYDKREAYVLSDGGTIHLDYMGECFRDDYVEVPRAAKLNQTGEEDEKQDLENCDDEQMTQPDEKKRHILFVSPGLTSDSQTPYSQQIVKEMT